MARMGRKGGGPYHTQRMRMRVCKSCMACFLLLAAVPLLVCLVLFRSAALGNERSTVTQVELHCFGSENASFVVATVVDLMRPALAWVDGFTSETHQLIRANRVGWVTRHGARYCEMHGLADPGRKPGWNKMVLVLDLLSCAHHRWIMYVDFDAIIMNFRIGPTDLLRLIEKNSRGSISASFIFSSDYQSTSPINSGVFLVQNTNYSAVLLETLYKPRVYFESLKTPWNDQYALHSYYFQNQSEFAMHSRIVHFSVFNQHTRFYSSGDFIAHYAGMPSKKYKFIRNSLLKDLPGLTGVSKQGSLQNALNDSCSKRLHSIRFFSLFSSQIGQVLRVPRLDLSEACSSCRMLGSTIIQYS